MARTNFTQTWDSLREKRNAKLQDSDWTQMADAPLTNSKKTEWATYRQQLRELPNTLQAHSGFVSEEKSNPYDGTCGTGSWPTKPS